MDIGAALQSAGSIGEIAEQIIDEFFDEADPDKKLELEREMKKMLHEKEMERIKKAKEAFKAQSDIIQAEADSDHWLAAVWRPLIMLMFGVIIANNYIFAPYLNFLFGDAYALFLELPPEMWKLLGYGITGYATARSGEKGLRIWQNRKTKRNLKEQEAKIKEEERKAEEARKEREKERRKQKEAENPRTDFSADETDRLDERK